MSNGLVERIKGVKDRVLFFLEAIKADQQVQQNQLNDMAVQISGLNSELQDAKRLEKEHHDELAKMFAPTNDFYSYPSEVENYRRSNPEIALLQHLRSYLPSPNVVDIGANVGDVSALLLSVGYRVFAFEPMPQTYDRLCQRFADVPTGFKSFPLAVGAADGTTSFYGVELSNPELAKSMDPDLSVYSTSVKHAVPEGMEYSEPIEVKVRSLKSLHSSGEIPADVSILKIDTEGGDLEVIKGMGTAKYAVIVSEFWDEEHYFSRGEFGLLHESVAHLRARGYNWHIVIYRQYGDRSPEARFYCNIDASVVGSWGNAIFFRDYDVFREALKWCSSMVRANNSYRL